MKRSFPLITIILLASCAAGGSIFESLEHKPWLQPSGTSPVPTGVGPLILNLEKALELAALNPTVLASAHRISAAHHDLEQASVAPNPKMSLSTENVSLEKPAWPGATTKFSVSQEIELGGKRSARKGLAQKKKELADAGYEITLVNRRLEVILSFNRVLFVQENTKLHKALLDATAKLHEIAAAKLENGKISRREFLQFDIALSNARLAHENTAAELGPALASLAAAIGLFPGLFRTRECEGVLGAEVPSGGGEEFITAMSGRLLENNLAIMETAAKVKTAQGRLALERARRWPNLAAGVMFARIESRYENAVGASLTMSLPIWDTNRGAVNAATSRLGAAKWELTQTVHEVAAQFKSLAEELQSARRSIDAYEKEIIPKAQESYDIAKAAFEAGRLSYFETLDPLISFLKVRKAGLEWKKRLSDTAARLEAMTTPQK